MENQEKVRKFRSKPMRWERFFRLKRYQHFSLGKLKASKLSCCSAIEVSDVGVHSGRVFWVNPFRRVKTAQPVKRSVISGTIRKALLSESPFVKCISGGPFPGNTDGHHEVPRTVGAMDLPHGGEPNNANNISGPTC